MDRYKTLHILLLILVLCIVGSIVYFKMTERPSANGWQTCKVLSMEISYPPGWQCDFSPPENDMAIIYIVPPDKKDNQSDLGILEISISPQREKFDSININNSRERFKEATNFKEEITTIDGIRAVQFSGIEKHTALPGLKLTEFYFLADKYFYSAYYTTVNDDKRQVEFKEIVSKIKLF